jgi:hypothetical protein
VVGGLSLEPERDKLRSVGGGLWCCSLADGCDCGWYQPQFYWVVWQSRVLTTCGARMPATPLTAFQSTPKNASEADKQLVAFIKKAATTNTFCGTTQWSTLLTLEDLAHRGLVQQVAFQWLEPSGWSLKLDKLDILNTSEITTKEIIRRVTQYVQHARLMSALWWMGASLCLAVVVRWSAWESLGCEEASPPLSLGSIHEHSAKR